MTSSSRRRFLAGGLAAATAAMAPRGEAGLDSIIPIPGPIQLITPDVHSWLNAHPTVRDAIVWELNDIYYTKLPYTSWPSTRKQALTQAFYLAYHRFPSGLKDPPPNINPYASPTNITLSADNAWALYLAHVAHSLALEIRGDVPWSLTTMATKELAILFDSREYFTAVGGNGGYTYNPWLLGDVLPSPPDVVYAFLKANNIPQGIPPYLTPSARTIYSARYQSVAQLLEWCGDRMSHYQAGAGTYVDYWQYNGPAPVSRVIAGTVCATYPSASAPDGLVRHWTAGCHGTGGFLRAVCRCMNIAAEISKKNYHSQTHFIALGAWLDHDDNPYNSFARRSLALIGNSDLTYPAYLLLVPDATYNTWFDPTLSDAQRQANVGRRVAELALQYLPFGLLWARYIDQLQGNAPANSLVFSNLSIHGYTLAQLDSYDLWNRMDAKIAACGGPGALQTIADNVYQATLG